MSTILSEELVEKLEEPIFSGNVVCNRVRRLSGKILTIIDACIVDKQQNKAIKDLVRKDFFDELGSITSIVSGGRELEISDEEAENIEDVSGEDILN